MDKRIIEFAIEALEQRKTAIETEIAGLKSALSRPVGRAAGKASKPASVRKPNSRSAASKKATSERMKAYWAKKKAGRARASQPVKARGVAPRPGPQSAAAKKAASERMKAYWAKRKAEQAKAGKKGKA